MSFARRARALVTVGMLVPLGGAATAFVPRPLAVPQGSEATAAKATEQTAELTATLARLASEDIPRLPDAAAFQAGARTIAAGDRVAGPVAVSGGSADVFGTVDGDVVTFLGDIIVHNGGSVTGNVIAIGGSVRVEGGQVLGQTLNLSAAPEGAAASSRTTISHALVLVAGWCAILIVISIGVLLLASENLATVADALERHYGSALVAGLAGQVAFAPLLVAVIVALVLSLVGILLVPFAAVAYVIIAAGLVTLGFLATAVVVGRGWRPAPPGSDLAKRATTLRALIVGILVLLSPWAVAALLSPWPTAESLARGAAFATTWVACTAGLGAALVSRAGIRRTSTHHAQRAMASAGWQTPTPISGVVAARRPIASPSAARQ